MGLHQLYGFSKITIVGDNHSAIIRIQSAIIQQMHGEIHIRAFFLGLYDIDHERPSWQRFGERCWYFMAQEMPEIHDKFRAVMLERP